MSDKPLKPSTDQYTAEAHALAAEIVRQLQAELACYPQPESGKELFAHRMVDTFTHPRAVAALEITTDNIGKPYHFLFNILPGRLIHGDVPGGTFCPSSDEDIQEVIRVMVYTIRDHILPRHIVDRVPTKSQQLTKPACG